MLEPRPYRPVRAAVLALALALVVLGACSGPTPTPGATSAPTWARTSATPIPTASVTPVGYPGPATVPPVDTGYVGPTP